MRVGIDAMGGDFAPEECLKAVVAEAIECPEDTYVVYGEKEALDPFVDDLDLPNIEVVHTGPSIGMSEHATKAVSMRRDSSINVGIMQLAEGKIDTFSGAGNTGAMMVSALYFVKTLPEVERPALTTVLPQTNGSTGVLLDVGANADVKPENLLRFSILGYEYAKDVIGIDNPKVGLINIGEEKEKGNKLTKAAYTLIEESGKVNFIGNVEGRDLFNNTVDVAVCDGFTGNIILKTCEGFFYNLMKRGVQDEYLNRFNYVHYGGSAILGIRRPVVVGHGISKAPTFRNMIKLSKNVVDSNLISKIESLLA